MHDSTSDYIFQKINNSLNNIIVIYIYIMAYITWYNIYSKAWFDAEAVAKNLRVNLSDIVLTSEELKVLSDLIEWYEYKDNKTLYMNLKCFNRVLNTTKRSDIHYFKDWFKNMVSNATTPDRSQELKFHKIYIDAQYEQKQEKRTSLQ
ncbi:MAG: hypothetical protein ACKPKO_06470 [Candidatus Fonsibacter sp.]